MQDLGAAVGGQERTSEERTAGRKTHIPAGGLRGRADSQQIKALRGSSRDWVRKPGKGEKLRFLRDLISEKTGDKILRLGLSW